MTPTIRRPRRWDDWRCYRCNRWLPAGEYIGGHQSTPSGYLLPYCKGCSTND